MTNLNHRQQELIQILFESNSPLTRDFISRELDVSTRTILNEIKNINDIYKEKGISIVTQRGRGYYLAFIDETVKNEFEEQLQEQAILKDGSEGVIRVKNITRIMIERNAYITIQEIADILYVSKQTISNDIKAVKIMLYQFNLEMKSRAGYGLYIEGDERGKRKCYCFCLPFNLNDENIFEINTNEIAFFKQIDLNKIFTIVTNNLIDSNWDIIDGTEKILTMHIAVSIMRIRKDVQLEDTGMNFLGYEKELVFVKKILIQIENQMKVQFSKKEQQYIVTYFISCSKNHEISKATEQSVNGMLQFIWENYHFDFREDMDLQKDLLIHMSAYEKRSIFKIWAKNPLIDDIKEKYILFFEMAISSIKHVYHDNKEIDEGEAGFVALHLVSSNTNLKISMDKINIMIVCAAGRVSGKLIEKMIHKEFGDQVTIASVISYADYKKATNVNCDIVLSNIALEKKNAIVYRIKGIPEREEIYAILQEYRLNNQQRADSLRRLFHNELFFSKLAVDSKEMALHFLCSTLKEKGYVTEKFEFQIFEREKVSSTFMGKGIAMPHPLVNESLKTGIAIATFDKEIYWDDKKVNMMFVINVKDEDVKNLTYFYDRIIVLMKEYELRDQLVESSDFDEFYHLFCTVS